jgi:hypothetical protein
MVMVLMMMMVVVTRSKGHALTLFLTPCHIVRERLDEAELATLRDATFITGSEK